MINTKEFRRGNWIRVVDRAQALHMGRNLQLLRFSHALNHAEPTHVIFEGSHQAELINLCEPVPLTEEILLKAGYTLDENKFLLEHTQGMPGRWITGKSFLSDEKLEQPFLRFDRFRVNKACDIYYLHQLQNLYYALTGEELEINL